MAPARRKRPQRKQRQQSTAVRVSRKAVVAEQLYFAYGSNLLVKRLKARVRRARLVGLARLPGWLLTFHFLSVAGATYCDIIETGNPEHEVWGAVFAIPISEMPNLDKCEGVPYIYGRRNVVVEVNGVETEVLAYVGNNHERWMRANVLPFDWYVRHVTLGAFQLGLPHEYQDFLRMQQGRPDPYQRRAEWESRFWQE